MVRVPIAAGWAAYAVPQFWSEAVFVQIAPHVLAGEAYKPGVLERWRYSPPCPPILLNRR
jgi:hypothetical protein